MFKINIVLLLVLCVEGALYGTDVTSKDGSSAEVAPSKNGPMSGLSKFFSQLLSDYITSIEPQVMESIKQFGDSAKAIMGDSMGYLARSEDTRVARTKRSIIPGFNKNTENSGRSRIGPMMLSVFMLPFKVIFRMARLLPYKALFRGTTKVVIPTANIIANSTIAKAAVHQSMHMMEFVVDKMWHFGKVYAFPRGDKLITALHESNRVPEPIMTYLIDLQKIYHIFTFLGIL